MKQIFKFTVSLVITYLVLFSFIITFTGCKKVDKLLNGEDNIEVQYPSPEELDERENNTSM